MFKRILLGAGAIAVALTVAFAPSSPASAAVRSTSLSYGIVEWSNNYSTLRCLDDDGNVAFSGNPIIFEGVNNNSCGGSPANPVTPLAGTQFAVVSNAYGGFALLLKNQNNGQFCIDNRGSTTNGTQYVIKGCNDSAAQSFLICTDVTTGMDEMFQPNSDFVWLNGGDQTNGEKIVVHHYYAQNREEAFWAPNIVYSGDVIGNC